MEQKDNIFIIRCDFCGYKNEFLKDELYEIKDKNEIFKEKYCLECNEPITKECPSCNGIFSLNQNFHKYNEFKELESFWDPKPSKLDELIPLLKEQWEEYKRQAHILTPETFRLSQREFLELLPKLQDQLNLVKNTYILISKQRSILDLEKILKSLMKDFQKCINEIQSIKDSIDPKTNAVNEKKEKQLKKRTTFLDFNNLVENSINEIKELRKKEINEEIEKLKPGFEKIKEFIKQDSEFYKNICPICNQSIFTINHQVYLKTNKDEYLKFERNLPEFYRGHTQKEKEGIKTIKLDVSIHIEKEQVYDFHADLNLVLHGGIIEFIGRNLIRELDYNEIESEDVLFDENDPLERVSNKQFSLIMQKGQIILQGMEYDKLRIGTFLNSQENDIRVKFSEGVSIKQGDTILIPLINELNNPNYIKIIFKA